MRIYGANGLSTDYPLERYYRDARTMTIPDGTTDIQMLIVRYEPTGVGAYYVRRAAAGLARRLAFGRPAPT